MTADPRTGADSRQGKASRTGLVVGAMAVCGLVLCVVAVGIGSLFIQPATVAEILVYRVTGLGDPMHWTLIQDDIVWNLRVPRVLLAIVVGAALSVVGVIAQAVMRNPLADPYVLGISSGAALGAVAWLVLGAAAFGGATVGIAAFAGAMVALLAVAGFVQFTGSFSSSRLVLTGIVMGSGFAGVTNFLIYQAENPGTTNSALRSLSFDIETSQQFQVGQMAGWLDVWNKGRENPHEMAWMGHDADMSMGADGAVMPGMATDTQLAELKTLSGRDAEVLFLQLMIAHHRGGVDMARAILARTDDQQVVTLANSMVNSQQSEIALMESMLAERGATDTVPSK